MSLVLITGAGKRIGRYLAHGFAKKGWNVAICYNESKSSAEKVVVDILSYDSNLKAVSVKCDIRKKDDIEIAFDAVIKKLGVPDVLINNAGIFPDRAGIEDISTELWDDTMNINLRGAFLCSQVFSEHAKSGARIINISSLGALEVWKHRIPYNVSKAGLNHLTKALAREFAPDITVNAVCPGAIFVEDEPSVTDKTLLDIDKIPMKRYGSPEDVFDAVYFFATCRNYITGQILTVDGGYHDAR